jgi:hypothetical protein
MLVGIGQLLTIGRLEKDPGRKQVEDGASTRKQGLCAGNEQETGVREWIQV